MQQTATNPASQRARNNSHLEGQHDQPYDSDTLKQDKNLKASEITRIAQRNIHERLSQHIQQYSDNTARLEQPKANLTKHVGNSAHNIQTSAHPKQFTAGQAGTSPTPPLFCAAAHNDGGGACSDINMDLRAPVSAIAIHFRAFYPDNTLKDAYLCFKQEFMRTYWHI